MRIDVQDITYHLSIHQDNSALPWLMLLHGFMGSGRCFDHLIPSLIPFCNPVTVDLLGHGKTGGTTDPDRYQIDKQVQDLYRIVQKLAPPSPFFLHGYSMGGRLALQYALKHPETLTGLILESTTYGINDAQRGDRKKLDRERAEAIETDFTGFLERWQQLPLFDNDQINVPEERAERYREIQQSQSPEYLAASLRGFGTGEMPNVKDKLPDFHRPVQLISGEVDPKFSSIHREMNTLLPESRLDSVHAAAHRVHLDKPEKFVSIIKSFLIKQN